jgi:hypothetical protein
MGPAILSPKSSRGSAFGDFDNDGDVDVLVMNMNEAPLLLRNEYFGKDTRGPNNWLILNLMGTKSNRSAIGARVTLKTGAQLQFQEVTSQSSYYSHNDQRLHFGLGQNQKADLIEITWPSGDREVLDNVPANKIVNIKEGSGIVR